MIDFVQPIVVVPGSHEDTIAAAAIASASLIGHATLKDSTFETELSRRTHEDRWMAWLLRRFTKNVRRVRRPIERTRIEELSQTLTSLEFRVGDAVAWAFEPMTYEEFPREISTLQVSGLDAPRTRAVGETYGVGPYGGARLVFNEDIEMSTGKTAAQGAHALGLWLLSMREARVDSWLKDPAVTFCTGPLPEDDRGVRIVDSGLTEIAPGSETVVAV